MEKDLKEKIDAIMADARGASPGMAIDIACALTIATMEPAVRETVENEKAAKILMAEPVDCILATVVTALQMMREILAPEAHRPDIVGVTEILDRHGVLPELGVIADEVEAQKKNAATVVHAARGTARKPGEFLH